MLWGTSDMEDSFVTLQETSGYMCSVRHCRTLAAYEISLGPHCESPLYSCRQHVGQVRSAESELEREPGGAVVWTLSRGAGEKCEWPHCRHKRARYVVYSETRRMQGTVLSACKQHEMRVVALVLERDNPKRRKRLGIEHDLTYSLSNVRLDGFSKMELQDMCSARGLPTSGTVAHLIEELNEFRSDLKKLKV